MSEFTSEKIKELAEKLRNAPSTSMLGTHVSLPVMDAAEMYQAFISLFEERNAAKEKIYE